MPDARDIWLLDERFKSAAVDATARIFLLYGKNDSRTEEVITEQIYAFNGWLYSQLDDREFLVSAEPALWKWLEHLKHESTYDVEARLGLTLMLTAYVFSLSHYLKNPRT
jgi:hypothetical protein